MLKKIVSYLHSLAFTISINTIQFDKRIPNSVNLLHRLIRLILLYFKSFSFIDTGIKRQYELSFGRR